MTDTEPLWGSDPLTAFLDLACANNRDMFDHERGFFRQAIRIDSLFAQLCEQLSLGVPTLLVNRAHSAFRGAVRSATSCQLPEAYMILRGCIEATLYAHLLVSEPGLEEIWLNRAKSTDMRERAGKALSVRAAMRSLAQTNAGLQTRFSELYNLAVDFGGHPNLGAIAHTADIDAQHQRLALSHLTGDMPPLRLCLRLTLEAGVDSLQVSGHTFPSLANSIGLATQLKNLNAGLDLHGA
jgi:hypothetical protein